MKSLELLDNCRPLGAAALSDGEASAMAALLRAVGDPARVKIVNLLAQSPVPVCACEFEPALGLAQPTVSHHLRTLTVTGLLDREERGKWAYFSLNAVAMDRLAALVRVRI